MMAEAKAQVWTASIATLFPEMFPGPLGCSLAGRARADGLWRLETVDIRDCAPDKHRTVDDAPFGGGASMVLKPDVVDTAIRSAQAHAPGAPTLYLSPRGRLLDQARVKELASGPGVVILCGRYEGVDERVIEVQGLEEVSLGDFVLSGGEPAALALLDACVRLLPGVIGNEESLTEESFEAGLLEYPLYTRPQEWAGRSVPDVLVSGHHELVRTWRREQMEQITRDRRPDLWRRYMENNTAKARG